MDLHKNQIIVILIVQLVNLYKLQRRVHCNTTTFNRLIVCSEYLINNNNSF